MHLSILDYSDEFCVIRWHLEYGMFLGVCVLVCSLSLSFSLSRSLSFSPLPSLLPRPPFYNRVLPQIPNWSQFTTSPPHQLAFQLLGLQACVTTPCSYLCFLKDLLGLLGGIPKRQTEESGTEPSGKASV